jgi:alpha-D-ribose 1-methylphosphonate 5-triphosphate diphosphatase
MERMTMSWLNDVKVVLADRVIPCGRVRIDSRTGLIVELVEQAGGTARYTVLPGLIDLHGDMLERDIEPRPGARFPMDVALHELDKRMAAAGITTAYAAVAFAWKKSELRKQEVALQIIETLHRCADDLLIDMRVHGRFEVNNPTSVPLIHDLLTRGRLHLLSVMDHTPGQGQYADIDRYLKSMATWLGGVSSDEVDDKITAAAREMMEAAKARMVEEVAAPRDWDVVREVVSAARAHGVMVASHDDDTVEKVELQAEMGVTISEFPVTEAAALRARQLGMHTIMGAPNAYRGVSTSGNLSAAEAVGAGLVDILATDYVPASMLHAAYRLAERGIVSLSEAVNLMARNPAQAMGLHDRGEIAVGLRADLVVVEEGSLPRVRATFRAGHPIYQDGSFSLSPLIPEAEEQADGAVL